MSHCCSSPLQSVYLAILLAIAWGGKKVCVCVKDIYILLPACVSSRDGDERRGAKRQCCGSRRHRDRV